MPTPLSQDEINEYIRLKGFDPAEADLDMFTGEVKPKQKAQPALSTPEAPAPSKKETFWRSTALSVLPSAASLPVGAAVGMKAAAATAPLATVPFVGPAIPVVAGLSAGLLAGGLASAGASQVQQKVLEQSEGGQKFLERAALARETNPITSAVGDVVGSLGVARPSPRMMKDAFHALTTERAAGAGLLNKLANPAVQEIGISGALGGGMSAYEDIQEGKDVNVGKALVNTVLQGLVSNVHPFVANNVPGLRGTSYTGLPGAEPAAEGFIPNRVATPVEPSPADVAAIANERAGLEVKLKGVEDSLKSVVDEAKREQIQREAKIALAELEVKNKELAAREQALREKVTFEASPENVEWAKQMAIAKGADEFVAEPTGVLDATSGKTYGALSVSPEGKRSIRASTTAAEESAKGEISTTLPEGLIRDQEGTAIGPRASTLVHENLHNDFLNMIQSDRAAQRKMGTQILDAVDKSPEFAEWKSKQTAENLSRMPDPREEFFAIEASKQFLRDPENKERTWRGERAALKNLQTGKGGLQDAVQIGLMKFRYDRGLNANLTNVAKAAGAKASLASDVRSEIERREKNPEMEQMEFRKTAQEGSPLSKYLRDTEELPPNTFLPKKGQMEMRLSQPAREAKLGPSESLFFTTEDSPLKKKFFEKYPLLKEINPNGWPKKYLSELYGVDRRRINDFEKAREQTTGKPVDWKEVIDSNLYDPNRYPKMERVAGKAQAVRDEEGELVMRDRPTKEVVSEFTPGVARVIKQGVDRAVEPLPTAKAGVRFGMLRALENPANIRYGGDKDYRQMLLSRVQRNIAERGLDVEGKNNPDKNLFMTASREAQRLMRADFMELRRKKEAAKREAGVMEEVVPVTPEKVRDVDVVEDIKKELQENYRKFDSDQIDDDTYETTLTSLETKLKDAGLSRDEILDIVSDAETPAEVVAVKPSVIKPSVAKVTPNPEAVRRRNIESDGRIYQRGELVIPTVEIANSFKPKIADYDKKIAILEGLKKANPNAAIAEIRSLGYKNDKVIEADSGVTSWDEAIRAVKARKADTTQYIKDIEEAAKLFKAEPSAAPAKKTNTVAQTRETVKELLAKGIIYKDEVAQLNRELAGMKDSDTVYLPELIADVRRGGADDVQYQPDEDRYSLPTQRETLTDEKDIFVTDVQKQFESGRPYGLQTSKDGKFASSDILAKLRNTPKVEQELLGKDFTDWLTVRSRVSPEEVKEWLDKNGPKVEVHNYGMEGKVSEAKREYDRMTHEWYDGLSVNEKRILWNYQQNNAKDIRQRGDDRIAAVKNNRAKYEAWKQHEYTAEYEGEKPTSADMWLAEKLRDEDYALATKIEKEIAEHPELIKKANEYHALADKVDAERQTNNSPRATQYYSIVSALPTDKPMPEWTKSKEGKNVQRVDVVIPAEPVTLEQWAKHNKTEITPELREQWDKASNKDDRRQRIWREDNLHENLPNTLGWAMIQYKTGPKGEKIAVIPELQSGWGQDKYAYDSEYADQTKKLKFERLGRLGEIPKEVGGKLRAKLEEADKQGAPYKVDVTDEWQKLTPKQRQELTAEGWSVNADRNNKVLIGHTTDVAPNRLRDKVQGAKIREGIKSDAEILARRATKRGYTPAQDHPLLRDYNRLILKAAIEQARKEGATHVMISDAETAMMTEKLDTYASRKRGSANSKEEAIAQASRDGLSVDQIDIVEREEGEWIWEAKEREIERLKGFQHNYDTILPKIAEDLTGTEGTRVSLGEHKNAFDQNMVAYDPDRPVRIVNSDGEIYAEYSSHRDALAVLRDLQAEGRNDLRIVKEDDAPRLRPDLVFRNPDGTPKTDVSGLLYDISVPASRREAGEKFTFGGRRFSTPGEREMFPDIHKENGVPVLLYHGSKQGLKGHFDAKLRGSNTGTEFAENLLATFLTPDRSFASYWTKKLTGKIDPKTRLYEMAEQPDNVKPFYIKGKVKDLTNDPVSVLDYSGRVEKMFKQAIDEGYSAVKFRYFNDNGLKPVEYGVFNNDDIIPAESLTKLSSPSSRETLSPRATEEDRMKKGWIEAFAPQFDKVPDLQVREAMKNMDTQRSMYLGAWHYAPIKEFQSKFKHMPEDRLNVIYDRVLETYRKGKKDLITEGLSSQEIKAANFLNDNVYRVVRSKQKEIRMKVETREGLRREAKLSPWYVPEMLNDKALQAFTKGDQSATAQRYIDVWADHVVDQSAGTVTKKEALEEIRNYVAAIGEGGRRGTEFGALRKAAGYGLPKELRERNLLRVTQRYSRRAAQDVARFQHLELPEYVRNKLALPDPDTGVVHTQDSILHIEDVRQAMKFVNNSFEIYHNPRVASFARLVTNGILGPLTGIRDFMSIPVNALPYVKATDIGTIFTSLLDARRDWQKSLKTGARTGMNQLDAVDTIPNLDKTTYAFNVASEMLRKYQGRDAIEQVNRVWTYSIGKNLAERAVLEKNKAFLEKFGRLAKDEATGKYNTDIMAKNFVDRVQGTYGGAGLPSSSVDGMAAPWFALARWSLEKSNVIWQDVIQPAYRKNNPQYGPLLRYALGAYLTGEAIDLLVEEINSGKKSNIPTYAELQAADADPESYVAKLVNVMQLGSFAGMAGDVAKMAMDVYRGEQPRGFSVPAATLISEGIGDTVVNFSRAVRDGTDPLDAAGILILELMKNQVQTARLALNAADNEDVDRKNALRDLRLYKQMRGEILPSDFQRTNPAMRPEEREFKRAKTEEEAGASLAGIITNLQEEFKNDPRGLRKALDRLKKNSYQTFPNLELDPAGAGEYYAYLIQSLGPVEAKKRLDDYIKQTSLNKAKTAAIP